ncbi:MAG: sporulation transcriptional regulator SpoIIID [Clostridia bacterium]|nr:sporulation transcriptional regulator SpoIIID [Clostridia bacterium]
MNFLKRQRAVSLGKYILKTGKTVRQTAVVYGISKSTVHNDISKKLPLIDPRLFERVDKILKKNFREKHIRGGEATKNKYLSCAEKNNLN